MLDQPLAVENYDVSRLQETDLYFHVGFPNDNIACVLELIHRNHVVATM